MKKKLLIVAIIFLFCYNISKASTGDTAFLGTWKGTSICQVKSSPCHDEIAAYYLKKGNKEGIYSMQMNKIVNGVEEEMGVIEYTYDAVANTLTNRDEKRDATWKFIIKGKTMDGTLYYKGQLYRIITLKKEG